MATAFTPRERERIDEALRDAALRRAATVGMRRTTVDELAREAGISKGAFYGFYQGKEHLFLSMLDHLHSEMSERAEQILRQRADLPIRERTMQAIYEVCRMMQRHNLAGFYRDEAPLLLRRLPEELLKEHYISQQEMLKQLLLKAEVKLAASLETTCDVLRMLMMSLAFKGDVGEGFDEALRLLIEGACDRILQ